MATISERLREMTPVGWPHGWVPQNLIQELNEVLPGAIFWWYEDEPGLIYVVRRGKQLSFGSNPKEVLSRAIFLWVR
jgi:hypothetical protein